MAQAKSATKVTTGNERLQAYVSIVATALYVFYAGKFIENVVTTQDATISNAIMFWTFIVLVGCASEITAAIKSKDHFFKMVSTACATATVIAIICCIFALLGVQAR